MEMRQFICRWVIVYFKSQNDNLYIMFYCSYLRSYVPSNERHQPNFGSMLVQCLRHWPYIERALVRCLVFAGVFTCYSCTLSCKTQLQHTS